MLKGNAYLKKADERLGTIISSVSLPTLYWSGYVFEDLVSCILDMQIRYRGNAVRYKRLKDLLENAPITAENLFSIGDTGLAKIKMSGQKYKVLVTLADHWQQHRLEVTDFQNLSDEDVKSILLNIKGIGNWTVDMILLYTLQRPNIFPVGDFHLKKIMKQVYEIQDNENLKKEMLDIAEEWKPYQSIAVLYLLEWKK
ncbi:MAG: hypothetical protein NWQ38_06770 [Cellulophaga sp.]|nr:hypothetical protein [Cellulophaga sp.]